MQVQSWIQLSPMLQVLSGTMMQMTFIFVGIILIALAFGIINTMLMAVMDRTREIGMLLSIGMKPSKVFGMIMLETIFLSSDRSSDRCSDQYCELFMVWENGNQPFDDR